MSDDFEVTGTNDAALFSLKLHRGEGMLLLAMNWKRAYRPMISPASPSSTRSPAAAGSSR